MVKLDYFKPVYILPCKVCGNLPDVNLSSSIEGAVKKELPSFVGLYCTWCDFGVSPGRGSETSLEDFVDNVWNIEHGDQGKTPSAYDQISGDYVPVSFISGTSTRSKDTQQKQSDHVTNQNMWWEEVNRLISSSHLINVCKVCGNPPEVKKKVDSSLNPMYTVYCTKCSHGISGPSLADALLATTDINKVQQEFFTKAIDTWNDQFGMEGHYLLYDLEKDEPLGEYIINLESPDTGGCTPMWGDISGWTFPASLQYPVKEDLDEHLSQLKSLEERATPESVEFLKSMVRIRDNKIQEFVELIGSLRLEVTRLSSMVDHYKDLEEGHLAARERATKLVQSLREEVRELEDENSEIYQKLSAFEKSLEESLSPGAATRPVSSSDLTSEVPGWVKSRIDNLSVQTGDLDDWVNEVESRLNEHEKAYSQDMESITQKDSLVYSFMMDVKERLSRVELKDIPNFAHDINVLKEEMDDILLRLRKL